MNISNALYKEIGNYSESKGKIQWIGDISIVFLLIFDTSYFSKKACLPLSTKVNILNI
jgi:hypothetical protein